MPELIAKQFQLLAATLFCKDSKKKLISEFQLIFYEGEIFAFTGN